MLLFIIGVKSPSNDSIMLKNPLKQSESKCTTIKQKCSKTKPWNVSRKKFFLRIIFVFLLKMKNIYKQKNLFILQKHRPCGPFGSTTKPHILVSHLIYRFRKKALFACAIVEKPSLSLLRKINAEMSMNTPCSDKKWMTIFKITKETKLLRTLFCCLPI